MTPRFRVDPPLARRSRAIDLCESGVLAADEWVLLGRLAEIGPTKTVRMDLSREHVLAIVGKRGSGKSFTLGSFLEGLATEEHETGIGSNPKTRGAVLFDTLNIFQWMTSSVASQSSSSHVATQARELASWGLTPVRLAIDLWTPAGYESKTTAPAQGFRIRTGDMEAADWASLLQVDTVLDPMGQLLVLLLDKVTLRGWTSDETGAVGAKGDYSIDDLLRCLAGDAEIARDYSRETLRAVRQRLASYLASPLFGPAGTRLSEFVVPGRLSVMLLSGVPDDLRMVVTFLLIRKLLAARAEASEATKHLELGVADDASLSRAKEIVSSAPPKCWVVIDEAQNVLPSERRTTASDILLRFVREGRNFGLSFGFTTQQPSAIDARVMAQVDTLMAHTLTVERDLSSVLSNLKSRLPDRVHLLGRQLKPADAIRQLAVGQVFVTSTSAERGFFMDVRPRVSVHGGFEG